MSLYRRNFLPRCLLLRGSRQCTQRRDFVVLYRGRLESRNCLQTLRKQPRHTARRERNSDEPDKAGMIAA